MRLKPLFFFLLSAGIVAGEPVQLSGIYPSLAFFNDEGECGTGAVVPWADRLWAVTYAPHSPQGSSDKLYEITPGLEQIVRSESVGGTPANRMIHRESKQLFIGPYVIGEDRSVRAIPHSEMYGRLTGNARHLTDPVGKIYYATMEEGLYEVDVDTLAVTELWRDEQQKGGRKADLPGYHGKGLYSGQGLLVYANNGDHSKQALQDPASESGALASWDGTADAWKLVRRNQFTELTGPGGIEGNRSPESDPVWTIGWDHRSLILMCLHGKTWHSWRLPKASHSYDGAHGWNTEWPRIRDIGEKDLLMTMHGTFWRFPKTFTPENSAGIAPRSNYLKVIGDFCRWQDRLVFGCDDTAKAEFLNKRASKGKIAAPQSQSNLWFVDPRELDRIGPAIGRGAVWMDEPVKAGQPSDAYLLAGYQGKSLHFSHAGGSSVKVALEVDEKGDGNWKQAREIMLDSPYQWIDLSGLAGVWIRLVSNADLPEATALFQYTNRDERSAEPDAIFTGLAGQEEGAVSGGLVRALGDNKRCLGMLAMDSRGKERGYYELDAGLKLHRVEDAGAQADLRENTGIPTQVLQEDPASVLFVDDKGKRWRLPRGSASQVGGLGDTRVCREVATERDLFHAGGSFYELPAENAGGFAKLRAVASGNFMVHDFCSYRGLFIMTGIADGKGEGNPHVIRSEDGKAALWAGAIDDIWKIGKPRGQGGPWKESKVEPNVASDPYLMTGFDKKSLVLKSSVPATITAEVDLTGTGEWVTYRSFLVDGSAEHSFPDAFQAYWIRFRCDKEAIVDAQLDYR
ncbi:hypothetical protein [Luteolibacter luteus]|uniref:Uncharacterized protein n=1 Tax=Luteolibacter luteus TaxID=2728835 RepID=A0A858REW9_9BACT|nr:hypothetical protein [Luteolibacter luteus]QJE94703.1 hypothetical protein HHL09_02550 [Luteolibacter luteus]